MATLSKNGKYIDLTKVRLYTEQSGAIRLTCNDGDLDKPLGLILKDGSPQEKIAEELFMKLKGGPAEIEVKLGHLNGRKNLPVTIGLNDWSNSTMVIQGGPGSGKSTVLLSLLDQVRDQLDESDIENSLRYINVSDYDSDTVRRILENCDRKIVDAVGDEEDCKLILFIDDVQKLGTKSTALLSNMISYARSHKRFIRVFVTRQEDAFRRMGNNNHMEAVFHLTRKGEPGLKTTTGTLYFDDDPIENIITEL